MTAPTTPPDHFHRHLRTLFHQPRTALATEMVLPGGVGNGGGDGWGCGRVGSGGNGGSDGNCNGGADGS